MLVLGIMVFSRQIYRFSALAVLLLACQRVDGAALVGYGGEFHANDTVVFDGLSVVGLVVDVIAMDNEVHAAERLPGFLPLGELPSHGNDTGSIVFSGIGPQLALDGSSGQWLDDLLVQARLLGENQLRVTPPNPEELLRPPRCGNWS